MAKSSVYKRGGDLLARARAAYATGAVSIFNWRLVRSENLLGGLGWLAIAISVTDFCSKQKMGRTDEERFAV